MQITESELMKSGVLGSYVPGCPAAVREIIQFTPDVS